MLLLPLEEVVDVLRRLFSRVVHMLGRPLRLVIHVLREVVGVLGRALFRVRRDLAHGVILFALLFARLFSLLTSFFGSLCLSELWADAGMTQGASARSAAIKASFLMLFSFYCLAGK
jgi:hypothetical protein